MIFRKSKGKDLETMDRTGLSEWPGLLIRRLRKTGVRRERSSEFLRKGFMLGSHLTLHSAFLSGSWRCGRLFWAGPITVISIMNPLLCIFFLMPDIDHYNHLWKYQILIMSLLLLLPEESYCTSKIYPIHYSDTNNYRNNKPKLHMANI